VGPSEAKGEVHESERVGNHKAVGNEETGVFDSFPLDNFSSEDNILAVETLGSDEETQSVDQRARQIARGVRSSMKTQTEQPPEHDDSEDSSLLTFNELDFREFPDMSRDKDDTDVMFEPFSAPENKKSSRHS
jgi:hypothetical protein